MMTESKLLIVHQGAVGDFVALFPAIRELKNHFDRLDVLCQSQLAKLAKTLGLADNGFALEAASFATLFSHQIDSKLKAMLQAYTKVVLFTLSDQLEHSLNQVTANRCVRIPPRPPPDESSHILKFAIKNLIDCGLLKEIRRNIDKVSLPDTYSSQKNQQPERTKILIHPGSGSIRKRWPLSQFLRIESLLGSGGLKPEFILGPAEQDLADSLQKQICRKRTVHIPDDLLELSALLKSGSGYIGNDSGASHLAACLGLPTVVVFGPADPTRWKPSGPFVEIVRPGLECRPCFETAQANCPEPKCLTETTPETVINVFYRICKNYIFCKT